jgi:hypothetical protein
MRPWMVILMSAIGAIVVATAMVGPELLAASHSDFGSIVLPHLPVLAVATLAVYALCAMLLATGTLVAAVLSVRRRLERMGGYRTPAQPNWTAAFGSTGLHRLVPWPVAESGRRTGASEKILLQGRFSAAAARGEVARLHYIWLARSHFFSALIVISALVGLGLAQDHGSVPLPMSAIPTVSAILILVGLILLAILGRIALDVSAEPLIETISLLAAASLEVAPGGGDRGRATWSNGCGQTFVDNHRCARSDARIVDRCSQNRYQHGSGPIAADRGLRQSGLSVF